VAITTGENTCDHRVKYVGDQRCPVAFKVANENGKTCVLAAMMPSVKPPGRNKEAKSVNFVDLPLFILVNWTLIIRMAIKKITGKLIFKHYALIAID
jgi:hypothetical protein